MSSCKGCSGFGPIIMVIVLVLIVGYTIYDSRVNDQALEAKRQEITSNPFETKCFKGITMYRERSLVKNNSNPWRQLNGPDNKPVPCEER